MCLLKSNNKYVFIIYIYVYKIVFKIQIIILETTHYNKKIF